MENLLLCNSLTSADVSSDGSQLNLTKITFDKKCLSFSSPYEIKPVTSFGLEMVVDDNLWPRAMESAKKFQKMFDGQITSKVTFLFHIYLQVLVRFHKKWGSPAISELQHVGRPPFNSEKGKRVCRRSVL